jgi:hypothetical protein
MKGFAAGLLALAAVALCTASQATTMLLTGAGKASGAAAYQGPGDLSIGTFSTFWSCRAFSLAKAGTKAYQLKRASDSTTQDINSLGSGLCDTTSPATFCNATTCTVTIWYDQTGNNACAGSTACDLAASTPAPAWTASSLNSSPCITGSGTVGEQLWSSSTLTLNQPFSLFAVIKRTNTSTFQPIIAFNTNNITFFFANTSPTNSVNVTAGTNLAANATDNVFHADIAVVNNTSGAIVIDGSATAGTVGAANISAQTITLIADSAGSKFVGNICEAGIISAALNSTQYGSLNTNMHSATNGWNF